MVAQEENENLNISEFRKQEKTAFILGSTGDVGSSLLETLLDAKIFKKIVLIGRREVNFENKERYACCEQKVVDFDRLDEHAHAFAGCDVGYGCLGVVLWFPPLTQAAWNMKLKVDRDYSVNSARIAKGQGCQQFHMVSARNVDSKSSTLFLKNKGIAEEEIRAMNFDRFVIYRPAAVFAQKKKWTLIERINYFSYKPFSYFSSNSGVLGRTLATAMINFTVKPLDKRSPENEELQNSEILYVAGSQY